METEIETEKLTESIVRVPLTETEEAEDSSNFKLLFDLIPAVDVRRTEEWWTMSDVQPRIQLLNKVGRSSTVDQVRIFCRGISIVNPTSSNDIPARLNWTGQNEEVE